MLGVEGSEFIIIHAIGVSNIMLRTKITYHKVQNVIVPYSGIILRVKNFVNLKNRLQNEFS